MASATTKTISRTVEEDVVVLTLTSAEAAWMAGWLSRVGGDTAVAIQDALVGQSPEAADAGFARYLDPSGDIWTRNADGTYDCPEAESADYEGWSLADLNAYYKGRITPA